MSPTIAEFFFRTPHSDIGDFAFGDQGASPLEPDRQGAGAGYLEPGKPFRFSLRVGEAPVETGMVVQERHTAPVGAKPAFLRALGTPCACCRRRSRSELPDADHLM